METKRALVTGATGQDGSYLAELLLKKGYEVFGMLRRQSQPALDNIAHIQDRLTLLSGDLGDSESLSEVVRQSRPDEVYNLAAQSHVHTSWKQPTLTADITGIGALRLLDAVKNYAPTARFFQASSSEMFGSTPAPQNESTQFHPRSPYAIAKVFAHHATINYRESYNTFAVSGISFNHESERRGIEFVTRKISYGVARITLRLQKKIALGNLEAKRDWGYAPEYVDAMHRMLQQKEPVDLVLGTGKNHSVQEFAQLALKSAGLKGSLEDYVNVDDRFIRPAEVNELRADPSLARKKIGWSPQVAFEELARKMVAADLKRLDEDPTFVPPQVH